VAKPSGDHIPLGGFVLFRETTTNGALVTKGDVNRLILMTGIFAVMVGSAFLLGAVVDWCGGR
jgi:hypothetical protein